MKMRHGVRHHPPHRQKTKRKNQRVAPMVVVKGELQPDQSYQWFHHQQVPLILSLFVICLGALRWKVLQQSAVGYVAWSGILVW